MRRVHWRFRTWLAVCCLAAGAAAGQEIYGRVDPSFLVGPGANDAVSVVRMAADGRVYVLGKFTEFGGVPRAGVARLHHDGPVDLSFVPVSPGSQFFGALAIQADGKAVLGMADRKQGANLRRFLGSGAIDPSFAFNYAEHPRFDDAVQAVSIDRENRIYVGGKFKRLLLSPGIPEDENVERPILARLDLSGALDEGYRMNSNVFAGDLRCMTFMPDGKLLAGGTTQTNDQFGLLWQGPTLFRLKEDGRFDPTFRAELPTLGAVYAVAVQRDQKILYVREPSVYGQYRHFGRLNPNGVADADFVVSVVPDYSIQTVLVQGDNKILICGAFSSVNGVTRHRVARLLPHGEVDEDFDPGEGPDNEVLSLALDYDGKVYVVGRFRSVNGLPRVGLARLFGSDTAPPFTLFHPEPVSTDPPTVAVPFFGIPNKYYEFEYRNSLSEGAWQTLGTFGGLDWGGRFIDGDPSPAGRFYQARAR
jgi:uncharacterized delta-60 repeat protein